MVHILGNKKGMTQIWKGEKVIPVTAVEAAPNGVSLVRTKDRDGYSAMQLSFGKIKREFRIDEEAGVKEGDSISVADFNEGDEVRVAATSKGRGFQGTTKRYNFGGVPKTHGQKDTLRSTGSIGTAGVQKVWKGRKMPGRMGGDRVTIKNLTIAAVDTENNTLFIKGAIPGASGGIVEVVRTKAAVVESSAGEESKE